jgi:hypothetical protein
MICLLNMVVLHRYVQLAEGSWESPYHFLSKMARWLHRSRQYLRSLTQSRDEHVPTAFTKTSFFCSNRILPRCLARRPARAASTGRLRSLVHSCVLLPCLEQPSVVSICRCPKIGLPKTSQNHWFSHWSSMTWMICGHLGVPHDLGNLHLDGPFARGFEAPGHASLVRWLPILMKAEASDAPERQMVSEDSEDCNWVVTKVTKGNEISQKIKKWLLFN